MMIDPWIEFISTPACSRTPPAREDEPKGTAKRSRTGLNVEEENEKKEGKKVKRNKECEDKTPKDSSWRIEEDKSLCLSWLDTTSKYAYLRAARKLDTFWERTHNHFLQLMRKHVRENKSNKNFKPSPHRLQGALESRWPIIEHATLKYCDHYSQASRRLKTGERTSEEIAFEAKEMFRLFEGTPFTFDHCWAILKHQPKWELPWDVRQLRVKPSKNKSRPVPTSAEPKSTKVATQHDDDDDDSDVEIVSSSRHTATEHAKKQKKNAHEQVRGSQDSLLKITPDCTSARQDLLDIDILCRDTSNLDDDAKAYFAAKKKEIRKRHGWV